MDIEGFSEVAGIITLAKALHDIGRYDIVKNQFFDTLCYDAWFENVIGVISSVFSGYYSDYDDSDDAEIMIFTDELISDYFTYAWEFGVKTNTPYDKNPYAIEARNEVNRQSKLIIYVGTCQCDCHTHVAHRLIQLYQWFKDRVAEFKKLKESMERLEGMAA